jgi:K+-sensing histidine kinase KdpD
MQDRFANPGPLASYGLAAVVSLLAVFVAAAAERLVGLDDLSLVFMLAVLVVASRTSTGPAVLTALLCFLAYNYFFIEPRYTLYISARHGTTTVALFLAAGLLAGRLASRLAMQVRALGVVNRDARMRQELGQRLAVASTEAEIAHATSEVLQESLEAHVWVRLEHRELRAYGSGPPEPLATRPIEELAQANTGRSVEEHGWWFLPLRSMKGSLGVIGLKLPAHVTHLEAHQRLLVRSMVDDVVQALERTRLVADLQAERIANETERLRSAMLASVSHDLRTPLVSIIGAAESLQSFGATLDDGDREALLDTVRSEGERLNRYIQNLLDMTRLGHGTLSLRRDWIGVDELIGSAIARLHRYRPGTTFRTSLDRALDPIWVHPALIEQALFNVIENAAEFSPSDKPVTVDAGVVDGQLCIAIGDSGPGIPEREREHVFDTFYSVARGDRGRQGTGLGLTICRGMVGAHGGHVVATAGDRGCGTVVRISLPLNPLPAAAE